LFGFIPNPIGGIFTHSDSLQTHIPKTRLIETLLSRFGFTRNDITIKNRKKTAVKIIPSRHVLTGIEKISSHTHQGNADSESRPDFAGSMPTKLLAHAIGGVGNSDYEWQQKRLASKLAVAKRVGKWEYRNLARKKVSFRKPGFSRLGSKLL
jgi:hypothetical protein